MQSLRGWPSKGISWSFSLSEVELEPLCIIYSSDNRHRKSRINLSCCFISAYPKCGALLFCQPKKGSFAAFELGWVLGHLAVEKEFVRNNFADSFDLNHEVMNINESNDKNLLEQTGLRRNDKFVQSKSGKVDIRALASCLVSAKNVDHVHDILKDQDPQLPLQIYSTIIKSFGNHKKIDPAMLLVQWLEKRKKETGGFIAPNIFIYNSLLGAVKQSEQYGKIERVMNDMASQGIVPDVVTYNTLMSIYVEQGQNAKALDIISEIEKRGLSPTLASYSTALLAYQRAEDGFGALRFFVKVREKKSIRYGKVGLDDIELMKLEDFTLRICYQLMRGWLTKGDEYRHLCIMDTLKLLAEMNQDDVQFQQAHYERLLWACTQEEHYTVMKELYARVRGRCYRISLSVCNHCIWLMGKARKWWSALEVYEDLLERGPNPNNLSYTLVVSHFNVLLCAAKKRGIWRWGVKLLNKMEEKGFKTSCREWNSVLVACSRASETVAAVSLFKKMVERGLKPTIISYGALLSALEKGFFYDEAIKVWNHMIKLGIKPSVHVYTTMASVCVGYGRFDLLESIIEMVYSGSHPSVVTYNAIISACARRGMGDMAYEWFHRMESHNLVPDEVSYEMLILALCKDRKPRLAHKLYMSCDSHGLRLSSKAYDTIIESARSCGVSLNVIDLLGPQLPNKKKKSRADLD